MVIAVLFCLTGSSEEKRLRWDIFYGMKYKLIWWKCKRSVFEFVVLCSNHLFGKDLTHRSRLAKWLNSSWHCVQILGDGESCRGEGLPQFIAAPVKLHTEELDIGHVSQQRLQGCVATLFDHLDRFRLLHVLAPLDCGTVKAPVAVATGRSVSPSVATARTNATLRVT